jgi:hypothetical protein
MSRMTQAQGLVDRMCRCFAHYNFNEVEHSTDRKNRAIIRSTLSQKQRIRVGKYEFTYFESWLT